MKQGRDHKSKPDDHCDADDPWRVYEDHISYIWQQYEKRQ